MTYPYIDHQKLLELADAGLFDKLEGAIVGGPPAAAAVADPQKQIAETQRLIKTQYGLSPTLVGSMPTGLNIPGDVDIDFLAAIPQRQQFLSTLAQLEQGGYFRPSPHNRPGTTHAVFTAPAETTGGYPVDFAVSYGPDASRFLEQRRKLMQATSTLDPELKSQLIERKRVLRNTPFDLGKRRYSGFKRDLDSALLGEEVLQLKRKPLEPVGIDKVARILDISNPEDKKRLDAYLGAKNLHGHRTPHAEKLLETGKVMSGLEALQRGHLQDYEHGYLPGIRSSFKLPELSTAQLQTLSKALLRETPDTTTLKRLGTETGASPAELRGALLRHRKSEIDAFLSAHPDSEDWRMANLRIPKLSPNVFLTAKGVVGDKGYGDVGMLFRTDRAKASPYVTLIENEAILGPKKGLQMQNLDIKRGLVFGSLDRIKMLEQKHPQYTYVDEAAVPESVRSLSSLAPGELHRRLLPHLNEGTLRVRQG